MAGLSKWDPSGETDVYVIATDSQGDTVWTRTYGATGWEEGHAVAQADSGFVVVGYTDSYGAGESDVYLIRIGPHGDTLWTRTYGGIAGDVGYSVAQTSDRGFIVAGYTSSYGDSETHVYLIRTDSNGDILWARTYGGSGNSYGYSVQETADGGYIVAGMTRPYGADYSHVYLIRTDSDGDTLWTKMYGGSDYDNANSVDVVADGGFIVAGSTRSYGAGRSDIYLIRTDSNGDTLWTQTYGGSHYDYAYSVTETSDGGYLVGAETQSYGAGSNDMYLIRLVNEPPDLSITVTPDATVVERGGTLGYTVTVTNNTVCDRTFEYWSDVYLWSGKPYKANPVIGPKVVMVKAGKTRSGHVFHTVPQNAPLKSYALCGRIGYHADPSPWDEDCFEFTVFEQ